MSALRELLEEPELKRSGGESGRLEPVSMWPFAALALVSPIFFFLPITHDAAFQMWAGRQMYFGVDLYSEIVEVNPPLWFWMAVPLSGLAAALDIRSLAVLITALIVVAAFSLWLCMRLWRGTPLFYVAFLAAVLPIQNFGQREHFVLLVAIPYVLLIARREKGEPVPIGFAILVGAFAALGFALKPHFALVPIILELWLRRNLVRPETVALAAAAAAYLVAVLLVEPDYFSVALPLAVEAYGQYGALKPSQLTGSLWPFAFALFLRFRGASAAFMIAALTFYLVYIFQMKGWAYQFIPASGMLLLALATASLGRSLVHITLAIASAVLALLPNLTPYDNPPWAEIPKGGSFAALTLAPRAGWPMVEERNLRWPLPYMAPWMAPTLGTRLREPLIRDLACNPPEYLLLDNRQYNFSALVPEVLLHYSTIREMRGVKVMRLSKPIPRPTDCRIVY